MGKSRLEILKERRRREYSIVAVVAVAWVCFRIRPRRNSFVHWSIGVGILGMGRELGIWNGVYIV